MKISFLIIALFSLNAMAEISSSFDSKEFYNLLKNEVQRVDAEGILVRNQNKKVNWKSFLSYVAPKFDNIKTWEGLGQAFNSFADGFVNSHSHFKYYKVETPDSLRINRRIYFEYPNLKFYDVTSQDTISQLGGVDILARFKHFSNYECPYNNDQACAWSFLKKLSRGNLLVNGVRPNIITLQKDSGSYNLKLTYSKQSKEEVKLSTNKEICTNLKYDNFQLIYSGINSCLLLKGNTALIRLTSFHYPGKYKHQNIYCNEPVVPNSMCEDVNALLDKLHSLSPNNIIFDLSFNGGGQENTPFIAALLSRSFKDLKVRYKKTVELEDTTLRSFLFYGLNSAESWFTNLVSNGTYQALAYGEYLPMRPNFCRGTNLCDDVAISPRDDAYSDANFYILVNGACASSCDDFTWRMVKYANAKVVGLPQMADATYSRLKIAIFYKNGKFIARSYGQAQKITINQGEDLIAEAIIPQSATVNEAGQLMTGKPTPLDLEVPLTKENEENWNSMAIQRTVEEFNL